jgi:hypothetical protein
LVSVFLTCYTRYNFTAIVCPKCWHQVKLLIHFMCPFAAPEGEDSGEDEGVAGAGPERQQGDTKPPAFLPRTFAFFFRLSTLFEQSRRKLSWNCGENASMFPALLLWRKAGLSEHV